MPGRSRVPASGKWRNGRRARFRSVCPEGREGSTPSFPTTEPRSASSGALCAAKPRTRRIRFAIVVVVGSSSVGTVTTMMRRRTALDSNPPTGPRLDLAEIPTPRDRLALALPFALLGHSSLGTRRARWESGPDGGRPKSKPAEPARDASHHESSPTGIRDQMDRQRCYTNDTSAATTKTSDPPERQASGPGPRPSSVDQCRDQGLTAPSRHWLYRLSVLLFRNSSVTFATRRAMNYTTVIWCVQDVRLGDGPWPARGEGTADYS
jgi:hypothetical protein